MGEIVHLGVFHSIKKRRSFRRVGLLNFNQYLECGLIKRAGDE